MSRSDIIIATFDAREPADELVIALAGHGIKSVVEDETATQQNVLMRKETHAAVHVLLDQHDFVRGEKALAELRQSIEGLITCPQCEKSRIRYPQFSRKYMLDAWIAALISRVGLVKAEFVCESCGWMWTADGTTPQVPPTPVPPIG